MNFELCAGEFVILEGANGSGKSTIIRTILGTQVSLGGSFTWNIPQEKIGVVPQDLPIDQSLPVTALDLVLTAFLSGGKAARSQAMLALEQVGMESLAHRRFGELSGGQRRRVLFARALATDPACLILDEPTVNMDAETELALGELLHRMVTVEQKCVLATSHVTAWMNGSRVLRVEGGTVHG